ncbi:hypothetical protein K1719_030931 [Acacia pycnantha]|nr:hypothetical protein K1719_030931 [Acacia pycnantha]
MDTPPPPGAFMSPPPPPLPPPPWPKPPPPTPLPLPPSTLEATATAASFTAAASSSTFATHIFQRIMPREKQPGGPSNQAANGNQSPNHAPPLSSKSCDPDGGGARQFVHGALKTLNCHATTHQRKLSVREEHVPHCKDGEEHPELHDKRAPSPPCSNPSPTHDGEHRDPLPKSTAPEQSQPDEETADPKPSSHNESPTTNATPTDDVPQSPHTDARHEDNVPQANSLVMLMSLTQSRLCPLCLSLSL